MNRHGATEPQSHRGRGSAETKIQRDKETQRWRKSGATVHPPLGLSISPSLWLCGSVAYSLPLDLEITLVEVDGRAANFLDLAVYARQLVERDLEDVAIIFVRASRSEERRVGKEWTSLWWTCH